MERRRTVSVNVANYAPGLRVLEVTGARAAADLHTVTLLEYPEPNAESDVASRRRRSFGRFVDLLDRYGREGGLRTVNFLMLNYFAGGYDERVPRGYDDDDAARRLFGEVLPTLPRLERVLFDGCVRYEANLATFASRLPVTSSLVELEVRNGFHNVSHCVPAIADMIRRNVPLQVLKLNPGGRIDKDSCRQIFDSLRYNSNLSRLDVTVDRVYDDVPVLPAGSNSTTSLRHLCMDVGRWTGKGKSSLARQLETNTVLEELHIRYNAIHPLAHRPWVEMLTSYNYTLRVMSERNDSPWARPQARDLRDRRVLACLRRNERIRQALDQLRAYHVSPTVLLPRVLAMVSSLPTLVYRFVRRGDVNALCGLLLLVARRQPHRRPISDDDKKKRSHPAPLRRSVRLARLHTDRESHRRDSKRMKGLGPSNSGMW